MDAIGPWLQSIDLLQAMAVIVIVAGVFGFVRKVWPWLKLFATAVMRTAEILDAVSTLPGTVNRIEHKLEEVYHETHLNNGSSIKDATVRIERLLTAQSEQIVSVLAWQQTHIHDTNVAHAGFTEAHERLECTGQRLEELRQSFRVVPIEDGPTGEVDGGGGRHGSSRGVAAADEPPVSLTP